MMIRLLAVFVVCDRELLVPSLFLLVAAKVVYTFTSTYVYHHGIVQDNTYPIPQHNLPPVVITRYRRTKGTGNRYRDSR